MGELRLEILNVALLELESFYELKDFIKSSKHGIGAFEWRFSEESFKHSRLVVSLGFPLCVAHRDLVKISEQRVHVVEIHLNLVKF